MPPEWMWPLDEEIIDWLKRVADERDEKYGTGDSSGDDRTVVPMMENEYAKGRR